MRKKAISPVLASDDISGTIAFYTNKLGFTLHLYKEEWGWANLTFGDFNIMFSQPNDHVPYDKPTLTGSIYIACENADEIWEKVKDSERICYQIEDFKYGMREFGVYDNNGYLLNIGHEIEFKLP
jgi:uncharacterized glyoxalase superfamily protein PhnB